MQTQAEITEQDARVKTGNGTFSGMATESKYHWMYRTKAWKERRAWQLRREPLCERCRDQGRVVKATVVHHRIRHEGAWPIFIGSPLDSLCKQCHDSIEQSIDRLGYSREIDVNGKPIDPRHPAYGAAMRGKA